MTRPPPRPTDVWPSPNWPKGQTFAKPASVSFFWDDRDEDGFVDLVDRGNGTCAGATDDGLSCDHGNDCSCGQCFPSSVVQEKNLVLKRNSKKFSQNGFGAPPFTCKDHHGASSSCGAAVASCTDPPGTGQASVANCCDDPSGPVGTWGFQTCAFSELYLGDPVGDLAAGRGSRLYDCHTE